MVWKKRRFIAAGIVLAGFMASGFLIFRLKPVSLSKEYTQDHTEAEEPILEEQEPVAVTDTLFAMDTVISIEAYGGETETAVEEAKTLIGKLESLWSVTRQDSEVYQMNHQQGSPVKVSEETGSLISFALEMAEETGGAFNPSIYPIVKAWGFTAREYRIPEGEELKELLAYTDFEAIRLEQGEVTLPEHMEADFGAAAKGYAGDLLVETMKDHGVTSGIINLGGNVALIGASPEGGPWRVGIRSPYGEGNIGVLEAEDCHIITSGGYERYFIGEDGKIYWHILNPKTGYPAESGMISATIIGTEGRRCDALSTAAFVMGLDRTVEYWQSHDGFEMILVTEDNEIYLTEGLEGRFTLNDMGRAVPVHVLERKPSCARQRTRHQ